MQIKSNIAKVIAGLRQYQSGVPAAIQRTVAPKYWKPRLEQSATHTLRAQWALERNLAVREMYERLTPRIVNTIEAMILEDGARFTLGIPGDGRGGSGDIVGGDVAKAIDYHVEGQTPGGKPSKNFRRAPDQLTEDAENRERVREAVLQWVREEKVRDERDAGLTDEEIADRIEWIMGLHRNTSPKEWTAAMQEAGARLANRVQMFIDEAGTGGTGSGKPAGAASVPQLAPEVAAEWLEAIFASWSALFITGLPSKLEFELGKLTQSIK